MKRVFYVMIERNTDGMFLATVPALRSCQTQAKSMDKLLSRVKEAIELCLEDEQTESPSEFVGIHKVEIELNK